jgi:cytochrome oxidase Cu insertion factor (SCO1/SenC/PrrC family)
MPGMGNGLQANNPTIISAFESALLRQALIVAAILFLLFIAWRFLREARLRAATGSEDGYAEDLGPEPAARRVLRYGFALLWLLDGFLQLQPDMPLGMPSNVIQPAAATSPAWVRHLVNVGVTIWNNHPVEAATSAVWIQLGIGVFLLVAPRGRWSRFAGATSVAWGLVVWVFGEAFGGIFAPGSTWLFGTPGGVLFYVVAGVIIALPEQVFLRRLFARAWIGLTGAFLLGMALLQAWPGRGFWVGAATSHHATGQVASMASAMETTPQPSVFSRLVADFGVFDAHNAFAVNLFVVVVLAAVGLVFLSGYRRLMLPAVVAFSVLAVATWVFVQDLGFFGGVGTDPNSMIPTTILVVAAYVALVRVPQEAEAGAPIANVAGISWRERLSPAYVMRSLCALGAVGIVLLGAAPMALASTSSQADAIIARAVAGSPDFVDYPAPPFRLTDQSGRSTSLASFRGRVVVMSFIDPVCTSDCPVIAQEMRAADLMLGNEKKKAEFVAIVANPIFRSVADVDAFDRQESLTSFANWRYLTGTERQLSTVWNDYSVQAVVEPGGAMIGHTEIFYVIDPSGHIRYVLDADPGPANSSSKSSFALLLSSEVRALLTSS